MKGFNFTSNNLPDNIKKMMRPEDRKSLGVAGLTNEEAIQRAQVKSERDLQKLIEALLRLKGVEPIRSRMDRKTSNNLGTPDFLFAVKGMIEGEQPFTRNKPRIFACAWEVKLPGGKLSLEQTQMAARMISEPNAWEWTIITSVDDALIQLRAMGIK